MGRSPDGARLSAADRSALERAIKLARSQSEQERAHIDRVLAERGWQQAGETAAYHCQDALLCLKPWQCPPCWLRTDADVQDALAAPASDLRGLRRAGQLVQKLLAAGLSRYEPDIEGALKRKTAN